MSLSIISTLWLYRDHSLYCLFEFTWALKNCHKNFGVGFWVMVINIISSSKSLLYIATEVNGYLQLIQKGRFMPDGKLFNEHSVISIIFWTQYILCLFVLKGKTIFEVIAAYTSLHSDYWVHFSLYRKTASWPWTSSLNFRLHLWVLPFYVHRKPYWMPAVNLPLSRTSWLITSSDHP